MSRYAFEGVHVFDVAWVGVGPITTKYLADNGADVIRVESATRPDVVRLAPPWKDGNPGLNRSQFYASYNTSKKGLTLDLSKPKARELAKRLVSWADIVSESFTPGVMRRWELDYPHLCEIKPDIIMFSTCMQGQTGPHSGHAGFGHLMASISGLYSICGYSEEELCPPYGAYSDFIAPRFLACAMLAALDYRRRTGRGQHIDLAQYEAALHNLAPALIDYFATGRILRPQGNESERYAPHGAYRCMDRKGEERWIAIAVADDQEWRAMLAALGAVSDPKFDSISSRVTYRTELDDFVGGLIRKREAQELTVALQAAGVSAYPVQNCLDLHHDENLKSFGFWHWLDHKEMGPSPYEGLQHRLSETPGDLRWPAPVLGQHNEEILGGLLGLSSEEIAQLEREGVIR